jgi:ketosteroid isomerase-like protein
MMIHALAAAVLTLTAPASSVDAEYAEMNAVYVDLASARAAHDVTRMTAAFVHDGILVDARPGPAISGSELTKVLQPFTERLKGEGVLVDTDYKIERRTLVGETAVDAGYMRQTMTRPNGQTGVRYARFMVVMKRQPDGSWKIFGDASMPSTAEAFNAVPRTPGLHYDDDRGSG